jgi:hypothetical protein
MTKMKTPSEESNNVEMLSMRTKESIEIREKLLNEYKLDPANTSESFHEWIRRTVLIPRTPQ